MLENIKIQGCDVVLVGHRDSRKMIYTGAFLIQVNTIYY